MSSYLPCPLPVDTAAPLVFRNVGIPLANNPPSCGPPPNDGGGAAAEPPLAWEPPPGTGGLAILAPDDDGPLDLASANSQVNLVSENLVINNTYCQSVEPIYHL